MEIISNFFRLESTPDWHLYQYRVDFNPPLLSVKLRSAMLYQHVEILGKEHLFNVDTIYLPHKLSQDVSIYCHTFFHLSRLIKFNLAVSLYLALILSDMGFLCFPSELCFLNL